MRLGVAVSAVVLALAAAASAGGRRPPTPVPGPPVIQFSGYTWDVKSSAGPVGPGPNLFSSSSSNVWVDSLGRLHLKITHYKGQWYAAEVLNQTSLGYGTYTWALDSRVDALDPNVVLGLFTYSADSAYANRELDIEFARWSNAADPTNAQFVVQPSTLTGHKIRVTQPPVSTSSHSFTWTPESVSFSSSSTAPASWTFSGAGVPVPGGETVRMNLWLFHGAPPTDGRPVEVVIRSFAFSPS